jgi:hypothetical protein
VDYPANAGVLKRGEEGGCSCDMDIACGITESILEHAGAIDGSVDANETGLPTFRCGSLGYIENDPLRSRLRNSQSSATRDPNDVMPLGDQARADG